MKNKFLGSFGVNQIEELHIFQKFEVFYQTCPNELSHKKESIVCIVRAFLVRWWDGQQQIQNTCLHGSYQIGKRKVICVMLIRGRAFAWLSPLDVDLKSYIRGLDSRRCILLTHGERNMLVTKKVN